MKAHKYCEIFPAMDADQFDELVLGMKLNGYRKGEEVVEFKGEVLDGRHRLKAAEAAGVKAKVVKFKGTDAEALSFVISKNLMRRHLTPSQRGIIAAEISKCQNSDTTIAEAAKTMGVSRETVQQAKRLKTKSPALAKKVKAGKMSLNEASKKAGTASPSKSAEKETPKAEVKSKSSKSLGQICREAYFNKAGGDDIDEWEDITPKERAPWNEAAIAVIEAKG